MNNLNFSSRLHFLDIQEEKIGNILIASDSRRDAIDLSKTLESCGFNSYVDQEDFNHS